MSLDILFTAKNRKPFVQVSWKLLLKNTNWDLVDKVVVYDDNSKDGTKRWLEEQIVKLNRESSHPPIELIHTDLGSPPAIMNDFISHTACDVFAKIDSDIACPLGWLDEMTKLMNANPEIELLGMEAGQTGLPGRDGNPLGLYRFCPSSHIGGVGLMVAERFRRLPKIDAKGFFGWTEHQHLYRWVRGWICPDLLAPQLDRIPVDPYYTIALEHRSKGWSRSWPFMEERWAAPFFEWVLEEELL